MLKCTDEKNGHVLHYIQTTYFYKSQNNYSGPQLYNPVAVFFNNKKNSYHYFQLGLRFFSVQFSSLYIMNTYKQIFCIKFPLFLSCTPMVYTLLTLRDYLTFYLCLLYTEKKDHTNEKRLGLFSNKTKKEQSSRLEVASNAIITSTSQFINNSLLFFLHLYNLCKELNKRTTTYSQTYV